MSFKTVKARPATSSLGSLYVLENSKIEDPTGKKKVHTSWTTVSKGGAEIVNCVRTVDLQERRITEKTKDKEIKSFILDTDIRKILSRFMEFVEGGETIALQLQKTKVETPEYESETDEQGTDTQPAEEIQELTVGDLTRAFVDANDEAAEDAVDGVGGEENQEMGEHE